MRFADAGLPVLALSVAGCALFLDPDEYRDGAPSHGGSSGTGGGPAGSGACTGGCSVASASSGSTGGAGAMGPAYETVVMADGPIAYWRLGDSPGSATAKNIASRAGDGSYQQVQLGATGLVTGPDKAATFVGSSTSFLDVGSPFLFSGLATFTLEAWVKPFAVDDTAQILFNAWNGTDDGYRVVFDKLSLRFFRQVSVAIATGQLASPQPLETIHVVAIYNGSQVCIYANASDSNCAAAQGSLVLASTTQWIGGGVKGVLDEVAIYPYPLPADRILAHYTAGTR